MDGSCIQRRFLPCFFAEALPDVILMDINMPGKSGIDLCKEVKRKVSFRFYHWPEHIQPAKFYSKNDG